MKNLESDDLGFGHQLGVALLRTISSGRTSWLTTLAALGIVPSVLLYRSKYRY